MVQAASSSVRACAHLGAPQFRRAVQPAAAAHKRGRLAPRWGVQQAGARLRAAPAAAAPRGAGRRGSSVVTAASARVDVTVPDCRLAFGEGLRIVGGPAELGGWDATRAPALEWREGDTWTVALDMYPGEHAFKLVVVRGDGSQQWEEGADRQLWVAPGDGAVRATCWFGDTANTQLESGSDPGNLQAAADAAAQRVEELRRGVADLTQRKQQLAQRLAGLEKSLQSRGLSGSRQLDGGSQLSTGWLFSSSDEEDGGQRAGSRRRASGAGASAASASSSFPLVPVLLTLLVSLGAGGAYLTTQGLDGGLAKQVPAVLQKAVSKAPASLQAAMPKPAPAAGSRGS